MNIKKYSLEVQSILYLLKAEKKIKDEVVYMWEVILISGDDLKVELKHKQLGRLSYTDDVRNIVANKVLLESMTDSDQVLVSKMALKAYENYGFLNKKSFKFKIKRLIPYFKSGKYRKKVLTVEGKQIELKEALQELYRDSDSYDLNIMNIAYLQGKEDGSTI
ncbi:hypothetical protein [Piscirickettsia salmonis]|uniref:hypothetical protein n=1 Tax=Piscirickettsia salmonis TaxID=1238 RepID=UPI00094A42FF|nr:hypothetical protein [Piscirickettsia salmonis]APS59016.1 hypothetical protein AVI52_17390 [Piscirickettsia salmonis]QNR82348.1 hypothetical protein ICC15_17775 [Piscirickettsia salmonis]